MNSQKNKTKTSKIEVNTSDSSVNGDIIVGGDSSTIVKQTVIHDNSIKYEVDKQEHDLLKIIAPYLIEKLGKSKILGIGITGIISGALSIIAPTFRISLPYLMWIGFLLLLIGILFILVYKYHSSTQCTKCKREFAYEEIGVPVAREVPTKDGLIKKTTTRKYRCKFCDHTITRKFNETIDTRRDSD